VYASPHVTFTSSLTSQLAASDKHIVFAKNATSARGKKACGEESGDLKQIDSSVLYLSDTPEVADMLLRAWERMSEGSDLSQREALAAALSTSGYSDFGFLSCGVHFKEEPESDQFLSAEQAPGTAEQLKRDAQKKSENAWVDRFRNETAKQRRAKGKDEPASSQRHDAWLKQMGEWKDIWAQRVQELQQENAYNETEAAEERRRKRKERRAHRGEHPKHVRYLPPDEAAKVQAKEEKWKASQEKQKYEDLEKAETRRNEFKRQVEEAQKIIEGKKAAIKHVQEQPTAASDELGAA